MYRLLLLITSLLISFAGLAQTPSDSIQEARKARIEKARAAAREKAEAKAAERAKMESAKQTEAKAVDKKNDTAEKPKTDDKKSDVKAEKKAEEKAEKTKRDRKSREEKKETTDKASKNASADKANVQKEEKPKKPSARERNHADTTIAKSKYGDGTFGLRGNIGATVAWGDYSGRENKIGFDNWGFTLNGGIGYRFHHTIYVGALIEFEAIEMIEVSPMLDVAISAPTPLAPFIEITAGPYISYDKNRNWVFQPRAGLSYRGKKNKIMRFGFGLRLYDDTFDAETFKPQYAASYTVEF